MGLYKLKVIGENLEHGIVEKVKTDTINYEKCFESWLENSPALLLDDDAGSTVLWIGRQISANIGDTDKYPDLLGIDTSGDLVIVELKKGRTPREVIAQILEYAAWGSRLEYELLDELARGYYAKDPVLSGKSLKELYQEVFNPDSDTEKEVSFNRKQKLYIVAEVVSPVVKQVSEYLRDCYNMNLNHLEYEILRTPDGEYLISVEKTLGYEKPSIKDARTGIVSSTSRWKETVKIKDVISGEIDDITKGNKNVIFSPNDVIQRLKIKYQDINISTIRCQIIQDCVNHTSRKHYPSGQGIFISELIKALTGFTIPKVTVNGIGKGSL
ncbi:MAG: DUF7669 domain-containing protein [Bacillota bacterium]